MNKIKLMKSVMGVVEEVSTLLAPRFSLPAHSSSLQPPRSSLFSPRSSLLPPRSTLLALTSSLLALLLTLLTATTAEASHINETLTLKKGWNGVYLESTPDEAECKTFFKDLPAVKKVMAYDGKGLDGMPLIDENGRDVLQPPVYYYTWNSAAPDAGTLKSLVGGRCYLIYASNDVDKIEFKGVPHPPHVFWRANSDTNSLMNLAGVSCNPERKVSPAEYFGEGPYDGGKVYEIGGTNNASPTMRQLLGTPKVANGTAYSVSANRSGLWPGVISVGSDQLLIVNGTGTLKVRNAGTAARNFQMKMVSSEVSTEEFPPLQRRQPRTGIDDPKMVDVATNDSWTVEMPLNGEVELLFKTVSTNMVHGTTYAAVLEIEDLGPSAMRVRVPVLVLDEKDESINGLWVGAMALDKVSSIDGTKQPFPAAGIMSLNVIVHVSSNGTTRLLQRAIVAADPDGGTVACYDNEDFPYPWTVTYRMFTGMMSVDVPSVEEANKKSFNATNELVFTWGVPERAKDNPFRHAWHPDHDGLSADYTMQTPSGDDPANYGRNPIKPELWSITNTLSFKLPQKYQPNADGTMEGDVVWDVGGLVSTNIIRSTGSFLLRRVVKGVEFVK